MTTNISPAADRPLKRLAREQLDQYRSDGYVTVRSVFAPEEMSRLAEDVERIAGDRGDLINSQNLRSRFATSVLTGEKLFDVFDPIADLSPVAYAVAHDVRLFEILHDIYAEPAKLFKDKLIYKRPGAQGASLHQDWISWPGFPKSFLTVLVAIDAFTVEAGATEVYPGVHRRGYLSPEDGQHHLLAHESLGTEPIPLLLEPGDIAIFGGFTPHRSAANTSGESRRGYFLSFNARSDGGDQYAAHYQEFHAWLLNKAPAEMKDQLFFR